MKQYKEECEIVMQKLSRIAKIIVDLCEKYDLSEEDLPHSLRSMLDSLQRFVSSVAIVLPDPHDLTKDQRTGWDRAGAEAVLQEKRHQRHYSTQGSVDKDQAMRCGVI